jgi:hypothetical protein
MRYKRPMMEARSPNRLALLSAAAKTAALLGFLLPWLHVDVGPREVVRANGLDLALGDIAIRVPILGTVEHDGPLALPLVLAGLVIILAFALVLLPESKRSARAVPILSLAALSLVLGFVGYSIYVHLPVPPEQMSLIERIADGIVRQAVAVRPGIGFLVTAFAIAVGTKFDWTILRRRQAG